MPERPDLEYVVPILAASLRGRRITSVDVRKPVVLRLAVKGDLGSHLVGRTFDHISRRAHFILFSFSGAPLEMVVAPMLVGRFVLGRGKMPGHTAVAWHLDDGQMLSYLDDVQMGKVYVIPQGQWDAVPGLKSIGMDVLDARSFTRDAFRKLARTRRDQAKVFLMDKSALDSFGNAYADEALFAAGIHPKSLVRSLSEQQLDALHDAMVRVLKDARDEITARQPALDEKLRDFVKVRHRHGEPCPKCGTTIRKTGVHGHDAFFCPQCQPETRKSGIVSWAGRGRTPAQ